MTRISTALFIAFGISLAGASTISAEMPTEAQKQAIRSDCRGDFIKHCAGVEPGGLPALECLEKNMDSLSVACQAAVKPVEAEVQGGTSSAN